MTPRAFFVFLFLSFTASLAGQTAYVIDLTEAASGWLLVEAEADCASTPCAWEMPVWSATYQVRDFAQYVAAWESLDAEGAPLRSQKTTPWRWETEDGPGSRMRVRYRVLADRSGPFGAYVDAQMLSGNLSQILAYPRGGESAPARLRFASLTAGQSEALSLERDAQGYAAESYYRLIDTPLLIGAFSETSFEHAGKTFRVVAYGEGAASRLGALRKTARRLAKAAIELMHDAPFESYLFVYIFSENDGGGMEYRNGTSIYGPSDCGDCDMASLTAHELFHLWNVKRIRPRSMEPIDFTRPNPSPSLWFVEGVTSTYAGYIERAAGVISPSDLVGRLERIINQYRARPAALRQSARESSIDAWLERYPAYGREDRSVSYYLKGELIGHLLDLTIRAKSDNARSLDDVMRRLNNDYARQGRFFEEDEAIERIASEVAGADLGAVFDELVRTPGPIAWNRYLGYAGYHLEATRKSYVDLGLTLANPAGLGVIVSRVFPGGPAERAGFRRGDQILRIEGRRVTGGAYEASQRLERMLGREVEIHVEREALLRMLKLRPRKTEDTVYRLAEAERASPAQRRVRRGWLERKTDAAGAASSE